MKKISNDRMDNLLIKIYNLKEPLDYMKTDPLYYIDFDFSLVFPSARINVLFQRLFKK